MAAPIDAATRYVSRGSFGCVVEPALPNENEMGAWTQFPANVSKIFRNRHNYNAALNHTRKAYNMMGHNRGHRMNTYRHNYKTANSLPSQVRRNCTLEEGEPIWVARMPHLGVSLWDVDFVPNRNKVRAIPIQIILQQIWKLLTQVQAIRESFHIHGDIRETNIMIHPETGVMTLIDFDWLLPVMDYLSHYPLGYYSNPPECLLANEMRYEIDDETNMRAEMDRMFMKLLGVPERREGLNRFLRQYSRLLISQDFGIKSILDIKPYLLDNMITYQETHKEQLTKPNPTLANMQMAKYYDSYGLGFSLYDFLNVVYPGRTVQELISSLPARISKQGIHYSEEEIRAISNILVRLKSMFFKMGHLQIRKRITIDEAVREFLEIPGISMFGPFENCLKDRCTIMGGRQRQSRRLRRQRRRRQTKKQ